MKYFSGISFSPELRSIAVSSLNLSQAPTEASEKKIDDTGSTTIRSRAFKLVPLDKARSVVEKQIRDQSEEHVSIKVIKSISSLIENSTEDSTSLGSQLEEVLAISKLTFSSEKSLVLNDEEKKKYEERMRLLRMKSEEYKYKKLTANIEHEVQDDVTTKSMTYAASIGLNMIVAPISFGVFMYFFANHVFNWGVKAEDKRPGHVDIRNVITAVISGVMMLFVEMILFVIRSHEFDASVTRKKKKTLNPFGYSKERAARNFEG